MKAGWQKRKLGDVCQTGAGGTPLKAKKEYYEGGSIPWLLSGEVSQGEILVASNFITQKGMENSSAKIFPKDTILIAMYGATAGQVGILRFEATTNQAICGIYPNNNFIPKFLFYLFLYKKDELILQATGNAQPNISQIKIKNTEIPIIPLAEQQRIVAILDEAFESIAAAKANAEKNLQNSREMFESYLQLVLVRAGERWGKKLLGEIAESISTGPFGTMLHKSDYVSEGIPLINPINIVNSKIIPSSKMMVSEDTRRKLNSYILKKGDVVIARRGELGRCAHVTEAEEGWLCGTGSFFVRLSKLIDKRFFVMLFGSNHYKNMLKKLSIGTTMSNLNHGILNKLPIPLPPIQNQQSIMIKLDDVSAETQRLESIYKQKITALDELKKSLLQKAFNGEL